MSARLTLMAFGFLCTSVWGGPAADDSEPFFQVPGAMHLVKKWQGYALSELPRSLVRTMRDYSDWSTPNGPPAELPAFAYDLNHDGQDEYFFSNTALSGTGGPYFMVYGKFGRTWRLVAEGLGGVCALPTKRGWMQLVAISRGGAGSYAKVHYEFGNGQYHAVLVEHNEHGIVTQEKPTKKQN